MDRHDIRVLPDIEFKEVLTKNLGLDLSWNKEGNYLDAVLKPE